MNLPSDDELRARFEALRREEHGRARGFRTILDRPRPLDVPHRRRIHPLWIAAAAAVVLAVGITFREAWHRGFDPSAEVASSFDEGTVSITHWRSPTASLLRTSASEALESPRILSSILDGASRAAVQH